MYWLLTEDEQADLRTKVSALVEELAEITGNPQTDQLFPYVGRKDRRKAIAAIRHLTNPNDLIVDPFSGSGIFAYATADLNRSFRSNEWEPYTNRISNAPWRLPLEADLDRLKEQLYDQLRERFAFLYRTICTCGHEHILDSLFFDRVPLRYQRVAQHPRLGDSGENITYRKKYKCPNCEAKEKLFDQSDQDHMDAIINEPLAPIFESPQFQARLIENSRINLTEQFTDYGNLFPHRSKLALGALWNAIQALSCDPATKMFFEDAFLSILPQAKYKDYRGKSQDLHPPKVKLREVNLLYRFIDKVDARFKGLSSYPFSLSQQEVGNLPIECLDFRDFLATIDIESVALLLTDPPWGDGNPYFEKAQLYHPWLGYSLASDPPRLSGEFVITDAPSRKATHDEVSWWAVFREFFELSYDIVRTNRFLALFFRPTPAHEWLANLNRIKLVARQTGFEPLLSIDVGSSDPSMRIQQSAAYAFATDVILLFVKLHPNHQRVFHEDTDIDQAAFQTAEELQEEGHGPFTRPAWRERLASNLVDLGAAEINTPQNEQMLSERFGRYCDEVTPGNFLTKPVTPFSSHLFDVSALERIFIYVPHIIRGLTEENAVFSFDQFLLTLSTYVENGTRQLIKEVQQVDLRASIEVYAEPIENGRYFRRRQLPALPNGIDDVLELDPYDFEAFVARLLEAQGYSDVGLLGRSGDRGIDVVGRDDSGRLTVVQCKRYIGNNVSAEPIQRLHSFAVTRGAERKIVITTSNFTPQAREEANHAEVELINGDELSTLIATHLPDWPAQQ